MARPAYHPKPRKICASWEPRHRSFSGNQQCNRGEIERKAAALRRTAFAILSSSNHVPDSIIVSAQSAQITVVLANNIASKFCLRLLPDWPGHNESICSAPMGECRKMWTTDHRGVEIQVWRSGNRWLVFAAGQNCKDDGHSSLTGALQAAHAFIDSLANCVAPPKFFPPQSKPIQAPQQRDH